jgi:ribosomal protein S27AE
MIGYLLSYLLGITVANAIWIYSTRKGGGKSPRKPEKPFKPVCSECGNPGILRDADAAWEDGEWKLELMYENYFCPRCGDDTAVSWVENYKGEEE